MPAFDTSKILIRANAALASFGVYDGGSELPSPIFEVKNESTLSVVLAYVRFSLVAPDARITAGMHFRNLRPFSIQSFLDSHLGFLPGGDWIGRYATPVYVSENGIYSGTLILEEVAGFAFDAGRMGFGVDTNYATFPTGPCMEAFKFAPALSIPFSGEVNYSP